MTRSSAPRPNAFPEVPLSTPPLSRRVLTGLRRAAVLVVVTAAALVGLAGVPTPARAATPCTAPVVSPVACENTQPGTTAWEVTPDTSIEGFTTDISTDVGGRVDFKIRTAATRYTIDIYRLGWYGGDGGRFITTLAPSVALPQTQPDCLRNAATGMVDCGNWTVSASWTVPTTAVSGVYVANLRRPDTGAANQITFVVRDDASHSALVFQTSDSTWQAYNNWGGASLYDGNGPSNTGRAYAVSYNRPLNPNVLTGQVMYSEYPMIRFLERNGYDISYTSGIDTDRYGSRLTNHRAFLSVGHDEYWSGGQRANVEAAKAAGVNLAFFSGNVMWWRVRWENSMDGSGRSYRTMVCYKESLDGARTDPSGEWTGTWRDPRFSPAGVTPENAIIGTQFRVNGEYGRRLDALSVTAELGRTRLWRNTAVAKQSTGQTYTFGAGTLGYEWDSEFDNGKAPAGLAELSETTVHVAEPDVLQDDFGVSYAPGTAAHHLTMYRDPSGALVFAAGTVQWSWGLDDEHSAYGSPVTVANTPMRQATVNLFADMGVQPTTLQSELVAASASTDTTAPTVTVDATTVKTASVGTSVTVKGTAADTGGVVAGVEVSVDGGSTWHRATGRTSWSYTFTPKSAGPLSVQARAVDDSARLSASVGTTSTVVPRSCPCSIWSSSAAPTSGPVTDAAPLELGTRFRSSVGGQVTGVRFYKGVGVTGTHTGSLWSADGRQLATGTFQNESASGWQTLTFAQPVSVTAGNDYVVSYYSPTGQYVADAETFTGGGIQNDPLTAEPDQPGAPNGVYRSGGTGFPTDTWRGTNYWVDVVFRSGAPADTTSPTAVVGAPQPDSSSVPLTTGVSVVFDEPVQQSSIVLTVTDAANGQVTGTTTYDTGTRTATFQPAGQLTGSTHYTASLTSARDTAGNALAAPVTWSFTTVETSTAGVCPCSVWDGAMVPDVVTVDEAAALELGMKFSAAADGMVTGVRFYKGSKNTGTHTGTLWSAIGQKLATATFGAESASGWQQVLFSTPVAVTAGTTYVVSYHTDAGYFSYAWNGLANGVTRGLLTALPTAQAGGNGVYRYGASTFPDQNGNANYWVDVVYRPAADTTAPTVTGVTPVSGATGVASAASVGATFSEPVDPASVVMSLASGSAAVAGTFTYDAATRTATLRPDAALAAGTTYTATVTAKDVAGNAMTAARTWSFSTAPAGSCPCTLFGNGTPGSAAADDPDSVELGVRVAVDVDGWITGVRFYKGAGNTGTHTGTLWTSDGTQLATGTFTGETGSGWQELVFDKPVAVTAGGTYVASYHAPSGRYAADGGYFASAGVDAAPLHAPAAGGNGVYAYGSGTRFPASTWQASNYWVDVIFTQTTGPADTTVPTVTARTPASGATGVAMGTPVSVTFSEPVTSASLALSLTGPSGAVAGSAAVDAAGTTATFTPAAALAAGTAYTVSARATDRAGNAMAGPVTWTFTTSATPDTTAPTVTGVTPVSGATGVASAASVGATFSEPVDPASVVMSLASGSAAVAGTFTYDAATRTATLRPDAALAAGTTYTATVTAKDVAGNAMTAARTWSFSTAPAGSCPCTLFGNGTPGSAAADDPDSVELGVRVAVDVDGWITGVRFYKGAGNTGTHTGTLWTSDGTQLATGTFTGETGSGWQELVFDKPVAVTAGGTYVASYHAPSGRYAADGGYFASAGVDAAPLHAPAAGGNGVYAYGSGTRFPASTWQASNYWVDVIFTQTTGPADTTVPTVTARTPASGATGVAMGTPVSVTFSEPVTSASLALSLTGPSGAVAGSAAVDAAGTTATFTPAAALAAGTAYTVSARATDRAGNAMAGPVTWTFTTSATPDTTAPADTADTTAPTVTAVTPANGSTGVAPTAKPTATFSEDVVATSVTAVLTTGNTTVASSAAYTSTSRTVTVTPTAALAAGTTYTVTVSGARDAVGNALAAAHSWSFTAAATAAGLFTTADTPPAASANTTTAAEVGMKVRSSQNGWITAVRFYKGTGASGTHVGSLWTTSGQRLAAVQFTGETTTGWQVGQLSQPVAVTAGTVYVVSYTAPSGRWSQTNSYFTSAKVNGPLTGLSNGDSANGVVGSPGTFPSTGAGGLNFWVDVLFTTTAPAGTAPDTIAPVTATSGPTGTGQATSAKPAVVFSEAVSGATMTLKSSSGATVPATFAYSATSLTATLTPSTALAARTTYTVTVSGARDAAGNVMTARSWTFTTA